MLKKGLLVALLIFLCGFLTYKNRQPIINFANTQLINLKSPKPSTRQHFNLSQTLRADFIELLKNREYNELNKRIEDILAHYDKKKIEEHELSFVFDVFSVIDPTLEPLLTEWISVSESWYSKLITARYLDEISWEWRGGTFGYLVPDENFAKFRDIQNKAKQLHSNAKQDNQYDFLWHADRISYANQSSDPLEKQYIDEAFAEFPKSTTIYHDVIHAQQPRWGGDAYYRQELIYELVEIIEGQNKRPSGTLYFYEAVDEFKSEDYLAAANLMEKAIELNPNRLHYYSSLARYYAKINRNEEAIALLNTALANTQHGTIPLRQRASVYTNLKKLELAQRDIESFLEYHPYDRTANIIAIKIYSLQKNREAVLKAIEKASYFTEHDPRQWVKLAYYPHHTLKDTQLAEQLYKKAITINKFHVGANYSLATLYNKQYNCEFVNNFYHYLKGCDIGVGNTKKWCQSKNKNWVHASINILKKGQQCSEINDYDFSSFQ